MAKKAEKATPKAVKPTTTVKELRAQSVEDLSKTLKDAKADFTEMLRTHAAGELVNPRVLSLQRKTIARVNTLLVEKSLEAKGKED